MRDEKAILLSERKHQETYFRWWYWKRIVIGYRHGINCVARVVGVKYIGNSVYGGVELTLEDGSVLYPTQYGYRPTKDCIEIIDE